MKENEIGKRKRILSRIKMEFSEINDWDYDTIKLQIEDEGFQIWVNKEVTQINPERIKEILKVYSIWADFFPGEAIRYEDINQLDKIGIAGLKGE